MALTEKTGHMAWCALVALALARREGGVQSPAQENLFLTRWLAIALKQRRFSRDVTPDIEWLLKQGRLQGVGAKLTSKLNYLLCACTSEQSEQNDLFRLAYILDTAKSMHWNYRLLNDKEWSGRYAMALNAGINGIYLSRTSLDTAFDDDGWQIKTLIVRLTGNVTDVMTLFNRGGWLVEPGPEVLLLNQYSLMSIHG